MLDPDSLDDDDVSDAVRFSVDDVEWQIKPTRKKNEIHIVLTSETDFNLIKTYLSLKAMCEKIEIQLNILDEAEGPAN